MNNCFWNAVSFLLNIKYAAVDIDAQPNPAAEDNPNGCRPKGSWYHLVKGGYNRKCWLNPYWQQRE
jgi:hypothetical protein